MITRFLSHVAMPERLILAWQAPDEYNDRFRFAVGEITCEGEKFRLRYFEDGEYDRLNPGKPRSLLESFGYRGYPGFSPSKSEHVTGVYEAMLRRLPPRSRSDFPHYQRALRIAPEVELTDFQLLALSEAVLPSDGFSIVDPLVSDAQTHDMILEVAGYRYYARKFTGPAPQAGDPIEILPEPDNDFDPDAVMIQYAGVKIGNVNRLQTEAFGRWTREGRVFAWVDRVNGTSDKPRLLLFVSLRPSAAYGS